MRNQQLQCLRWPQIVRIEKRNHVSARQSQPVVARRRGTLVTLPNAGHFSAESCRDISRAVRRTIINDNYFQRAVALLPDGSEGVREELPRVVHGSDDTKKTGPVYHARPLDRALTTTSGIWAKSVPHSRM